jgi:hypothetical protein
MRKRVIFLSAVLLTLLSALSYAQAPVPFVNLPLVPDATAPGGPQFTLTVNGTGFVSNSVVNWNGTLLATQFVSGSQLTATVPAADISTASTASVTVVNPAPGGGTSSVAFFTVTANTGNSVAFTLASSPAVGAYPDSVAVGDFNGDGKLDLAVANTQDPGGPNNGTVSILLGDGTGNFTLASSPGAGNYPYSIAVGDFNGDGKLDLAVVNYGSDYGESPVSILLGDGTGNFTLASSPAVGFYPTDGVVGDFNGDGKLDLVVANHLGGNLSVLLGDGTGNFTLASSPGVPDPLSIAVGDFNGDGKLDLVTVAYYNASYSILLGDGTGNFNLASTTSMGTNLYSVAVGDFNGDGKLDLAVLDDNNTVFILLGDGTGNFKLASSAAVGSGANRVVVGDFNGDGNLDLATANSIDNTVSILLGDGKGNFTLASSPAVGNSPAAVAVGDFNGDGRLDLVTPNFYGNTVSILLGSPLGPVVALSPSSLIFGPQLLGTSSAPQQVTLTNIGSEMLDITRVVTSATFSQTNNCPRKLPPGGQCTANVVFTPRKINTITGTITITDNAPNSPQTVPLTGVGTAVTLLPSSLNFGDQQVGTLSQPQTVTLTNYAPRAVTISGGSLIGNNPGSFAVQNNSCGTSLPPGQSCTANITFTPKGKGLRTATFEVNDNGGASPQTVSLSGTGT